MGYISAQTATTLTIQLTEQGRQSMLSTGSFISLFDKFAISDGSIDYRNTQAHGDSSSTSNNSAQFTCRFSRQKAENLPLRARLSGCRKFLFVSRRRRG